MPRMRTVRATISHSEVICIEVEGKHPQQSIGDEQADEIDGDLTSCPDGRVVIDLVDEVGQDRGGQRQADPWHDELEVVRNGRKPHSTMLRTMTSNARLTMTAVPYPTLFAWTLSVGRFCVVAILSPPATD